jgi:hypothetical protein
MNMIALNQQHMYKCFCKRRKKRENIFAGIFNANEDRRGTSIECNLLVYQDQIQSQ